ncbi:allantoate amidohydrolase [Microbulbifer aggregans]|uniref:allantoate amidohydrolase n=1 Tax=Microbulbifer aggregans TaxID=1769779 RepID=UPI001CFE5D92|nr:allantoate amidohydrolase [Microbulbifer aggregans]
MSAERLLQRCDLLAAISATEGSICRTYLTDEHRRCNQQVMQWMYEAGMETRTDAAGNCWGHYAGSDADGQTLVLGSHLDTVPGAGRYDGILGVLAAIEVVSRFHHRGKRFPFHIDVVGFADEEGSRFGATLLGSRAVAGQWDPGLLELRDADGVSMAEAFTAFGLDPTMVATASRAGELLLGYWELHIEQGPVLEERDLALGVVTAIAGARRLQFTLQGRAGHAGTVPMTMRQDALLAAAGAVQLVDAVARRCGVVATVGKIEAQPGSVNVIPGRCEFTLDIRSGEDLVRDCALAKIIEGIESLCDRSQVAMEYREIHRAPAVACAPRLREAGSRALVHCGQQDFSLPSGAGHDAMAMAAATDVGMLFLRCAAGISHHPDESVDAGDVALALDVLEAAVEDMETLS